MEMEPLTYLVVDGENIDTTLGVSVLDHKPLPEERPRWDRVLESTREFWDQDARGLFFLNASSGYLPMSFVQALLAMNFRPIPLAGPASVKIVDEGVKMMLKAIAERGSGDVILASHDGDFVPEIETLLRNGHRVAIMGFPEFLSGHLHELTEIGLEILDMEHDVHAFQVPLPRLEIIELDKFDPYDFL